MRRIPFTEAEIFQLKKERIEHEHPIVRRRMMALYMKAVGYRHKEICFQLNISHVCLYEYLDLYLKQGLDGLRHLGYKGKRNLLDENRDVIIAHLETQPPATLKEARVRIEEITGLVDPLRDGLASQLFDTQCVCPDDLWGTRRALQ